MGPIKLNKMETEGEKTQIIQKSVIELSKLLQEPDFSKFLLKLTPEEASIAKSLSLEIEIHPNLGNHFPRAAENQIWSSFTFKNNQDPTSLVAARTEKGIIVLRKHGSAYKKKDTKAETYYILDCASGKKCYFLFSHSRGILKKDHNEYLPPQGLL